MWRLAVGVALSCSALAYEAAAAELATLLAPGAEAVKIAGDCKFTEGPAFSPKGFLLFSDIPNERIVRFEQDGSVSDYMKPSGKANGLVFDAAGHLYACQGGARRVVRVSAVDGKVEVLADKYQDKRLNSPNDLALDGQGGLYFTDPRYGDDTERDLSFMGVFYVAPTGEVSLVTDGRERPNGILVSGDGRSLYVAEPNKRELWKYAITEPGKVGEGELIFTGDEKLDGSGPDGMALDAEGRIYATYGGIVVLEPNGELIGRIPVAERPANCTFGGADLKTLFITARTSLYKVDMAVPGAPLAEKGPRPAMHVGRGSRQIPVRLVSEEKPAGEAPGKDVEPEPKLKEVKIEDITLNVPESWMQQPPSNRLRLAQFEILPVKGDKEPAELVISFFRGDGGGIQPNLVRWNDQFQKEGRTVTLWKGTSPQGDYVVSDISGTYLKSEGGPFAPGKKTPMVGYRSVSAILQVKGVGNYFLRLTGPERTAADASEYLRMSFGGDAKKETPYEPK